MKRDQMKRIALRHIEHKKPFVIAGGVGVGKTELVYEIAKELDCEILVAEHLSQISPVDVRGCLFPDKEKSISRWYPPERFPTKGYGIYFLDELDKADRETQKACLQLFTEREIGGVKLGDRIALIGACNRPEDDSTADTFSEAFRSRVTWYVLDHDVDEWCKYANKRNFPPEIVGFMRFDSTWLHRQKIGDLAMPTPRTWTRIAELWDAFSDSNEDLNKMIEGSVGQAAATQFNLFVSIYRTVDVKNILENGVVPNFNETNGLAIAAVIAVSEKLNRSAKLKKEWKINKFLEGLTPDQQILFAYQVKPRVMEAISDRTDCRDISEKLREIVLSV